MRLIHGWRDAWRLWSVRLNLIGLVLMIGEQALPMWGFVPFEARAWIPRPIAIGLPIACFVAATVARVVRQERLRHAPRPQRG